MKCVRCNDVYSNLDIEKIHYFMIRGNNYKVHNQCIKEILTEVLFHES